MSEEELLRELDQKLRRLSVEGLWSQASEADMATYSMADGISHMAYGLYKKGVGDDRGYRLFG